jgi:uncharacterized phiE125 gp8 family phage protein
MNYHLNRPDQLPIDITLAREFLREIDPSKDPIITATLAAAVTAVENQARVVTTTRTGTLFLPAIFFPRTELPFSPVQSITSIEVLSEDESTYTPIPAEEYSLIKAEFAPAIWFGDHAPVMGKGNHPENIKITFVAGYGSPDAVPADIKQAILLTLGHYYENRNDSVYATVITSLPRGAAHLINSFKRYRA